jgi:hypothetical protein
MNPKFTVTGPRVVLETKMSLSDSKTHVEVAVVFSHPMGKTVDAARQVSREPASGIALILFIINLLRSSDTSLFCS